MHDTIAKDGGCDPTGEKVEDLIEGLEGKFCTMQLNFTLYDMAWPVASMLRCLLALILWCISMSYNIIQGGGYTWQNCSR